MESLGQETRECLGIIAFRFALDLVETSTASSLVLIPLLLPLLSDPGSALQRFALGLQAQGWSCTGRSAIRTLQSPEGGEPDIRQSEGAYPGLEHPCSMW